MSRKIKYTLKFMVGQVFNYLKVVGTTNKKAGYSAIWKCVCLCPCNIHKPGDAVREATGTQLTKDAVFACTPCTRFLGGNPSNKQDRHSADNGNGNLEPAEIAQSTPAIVCTGCPVETVKDFAYGKVQVKRFIRSQPNCPVHGLFSTPKPNATSGALTKRYAKTTTVELDQEE